MKINNELAELQRSIELAIPIRGDLYNEPQGRCGNGENFEDQSPPESVWF